MIERKLTTWLVADFRGVFVQKLVGCPAGALSNTTRARRHVVGPRPRRGRATVRGAPRSVRATRRPRAYRPGTPTLRRDLRARSSLSPLVFRGRPPRAPRAAAALPSARGPAVPDDAERQRAIDRLSPKLPGTTGTGDAGDGPPPESSRPRDVTRPRRFKDAVRDRVDADVRRKARSDPRPDGDEDPGPDPRELARKRRLERAEAESADRLEYLVAVIRAELGRPQSLLSVDGKTRDLRFASCFHRLRNFGAVEIAFGLVKYYDQHWDEAAPELSAARSLDPPIVGVFVPRRRSGGVDRGPRWTSPERPERLRGNA